MSGLAVELTDPPKAAPEIPEFADPPKAGPENCEFGLLVRIDGSPITVGFVAISVGWNDVSDPRA